MVCQAPCLLHAYLPPSLTAYICTINLLKQHAAAVFLVLKKMFFVISLFFLFTVRKKQRWHLICKWIATRVSTVCRSAEFVHSIRGAHKTRGAKLSICRSCSFTENTVMVLLLENDWHVFNWNDLNYQHFLWKKYFPTKVRFAHIYFSHLKQDTGGVSGKKSNF